MQNPNNVVNPGLVNVADAGYGSGEPEPDQPVGTSPSTSSGPVVQAGSARSGVGEAEPDQPVTETPAMTASTTVDGGLYSPQSPDTVDVIENDVVGQVYGQGSPTNVFV